MTQTTDSELLDKYLSGTLSANERATLLEILNDANSREQLMALIEEDFLQDHFEADNDPELRDLIHQFLDANIAEAPVQRRIPSFFRYAAAAVLLIGIGLTWYWWPSAKRPQTAQTERFKNDIVPAPQTAMLTLADGSVVQLSEQANGMVRSEGGAQLTKNGESLSYKQQKDPAAVVFNKVTTAKGSQYQIVLADGTKVWLNAASSLRFPTAFPGSERVVELTGEGYFEVAKSAAQPFLLNTAGATVKVLGTQFNVNAYTDEQGSNTTLIEGKVQVNDKLLQPGQQAKVSAGGAVMIRAANIEEVISWKNGMFRFDNRPVSSIMREIERWYDVEVEYIDRVDLRLTSIQPRNIPVSKLLKTLEMTDAVRFEIEGKKIKVMSVSSR